MKRKTLKEVKKAAYYNLESQALSHKQSQKGITLIALVVTIIVLLILAGVTIITLLGENGIIKKAEKAKEETNQKTLDEQEKFENLINKMNSALNGGGGTPEEAVKTASVYAKLYTYTDGSGDILVLSSNKDFEDASENVTLKQDYGNIGANKYYSNPISRYVENEGGVEEYHEEAGVMPPWLEKITNTDEREGYKYTATYYGNEKDNISENFG